MPLIHADPNRCSEYQKVPNNCVAIVASTTPIRPMLAIHYIICEEEEEK